MTPPKNEFDAAKQVHVTQEDVRQIKADVEKISSKINLVHDALIGNPISQDGGMVKRLDEVEENQKTLDTKVNNLISVYKENRRYLYWLCSCAGGLIISLADILFQHIFKK